MTKRRGGLGSGLDALLPNTSTNVSNDTSSIREIPIGDIRPNRYQPRKTFDEQAIIDLAESIKEHGIVQPLLVTRLPSGGYELIAGERRLRAAIQAKLTVVPVVIRESTPQEMLEIAIIENIQRADLNPMEEALAYQALKDEFNLSDESIAKRMGKASRVQITNTRRLLRLIDSAQIALRAGQISAGHGRALLKVDDPQDQHAMLDWIMRENITVRETEQLTDQPFSEQTIRTQIAKLRGTTTTTPDPATGKPKKPVVDLIDETSIDDRNVAKELETRLSTPVSIQRTPRDVRLTLVFHTHEKLQEFLDMFN
jgi:ParB family transcriptional regulator, chromosome partitioning protein